MAERIGEPQTALKYETEVHEQGRIELRVPLAAGARVTVFIIPDVADAFSDLLAAAATSLAFWDNPFDDEDWNAA